MSSLFLFPADTGGMFSYISTLPEGAVVDNVFYAHKNGSYYKRIINSSELFIEWFGAKGDGETNDTNAFKAAAAYIEQQGGGTLNLTNGKTYIIGTQQFAGNTGLNYAYRGDGLTRNGVFEYGLFQIFNCPNPIQIKGNGATVKFADGLHFGAFDPVTGSPYSHSLPFTGSDYIGNITNLFRFKGNHSVFIENIKLDGNLQNYVIGGQWGDTGYQLSSVGIWADDNDVIELNNVTCFHFGEDGMVISNTIPDENAPLKKINIYNSNFYGNGRQGWSWVGGNHAYVENCNFYNTGQTVNIGTGQPLVSLPGAGVDIEAEAGLIRNGTFVNCRFWNNAGVGLVADAGNISNVKVISSKLYGDKNWAVWIVKPNFTFIDCDIIGGAVHGYGSPSDKGVTRWLYCKFDHDASKTPTGEIYGDLVDWGSGLGNVCIGCTFNAVTPSRLPYCASNVALYDCILTQTGTPSVNSFTRGIYRGTSYITSTTMDLNGATIEENVYLNGDLLESTPTRNYKTFTNNSAAITGGLLPNQLYKTPTGEIRTVVLES